MSLSNDTTANVSQGSLIVNQTMDVINQLATNFKEASETIDLLKKETENIGSVLGSIQGISEQTNLLALNAAIEAARAGEQGRGFADEVRTLAKRTQDSTLEIQSMIERLQNGAMSAVTLMERSTADAAHGVEIISKADERLNLISSAMSEMNHKNQQIKHAVDNQSDSINNIHENINNVSRLTESSHQGSVGSAAESEILKQLTIKLVHIFDQFKVQSN